MDKPSKAKAAQRMADEWSALGAALAGLNDEQMLQSGVVEGWSVKDLLGHIAFWADVAAKNTELVKAGREGDIIRPESPEAVNRWNAREQQLRAGRSLAEVRQEVEESHRRALTALAALPEERLGLDVEIGVGLRGTFLQLYAVDTYDHYREHAEQIIAWRRRQ